MIILMLERKITIVIIVIIMRLTKTMTIAEHIVQTISVRVMLTAMSVPIVMQHMRRTTASMIITIIAINIILIKIILMIKVEANLPEISMIMQLRTINPTMIVNATTITTSRLMDMMHEASIMVITGEKNDERMIAVSNRPITNNVGDVTGKATNSMPNTMAGNNMISMMNGGSHRTVVTVTTTGNAMNSTLVVMMTISATGMMVITKFRLINVIRIINITIETQTVVIKGTAIQMFGIQIIVIITTIDVRTIATQIISIPTSGIL